MRYAIYLEIAGFTCQLGTINQKWYKFLKEKYKYYIVKKLSPHQKLNLNIYLNFTPKKYKITFKKNVKRIDFFWPQDFSSFKKFDLNFKTIFGWLLIKNNGFLLHSSSILKNNKAYLFTGKSGSGKSTIVKYSQKHYPVINDDFSIIKKVGKKFYIFSSPFHESLPVQKKVSKKLIRNVFFIKQAPENQIKRINKKRKVKYLLSNIKNVNLSTTKFPSPKHPSTPLVFFRDDSNILTNLWAICYDFINQTPIHLLFMRKGASFWKTIENYEKTGKI